MYLRRCGGSKASQTNTYWQLVESVRTESGPRQRVVSYLGALSAPVCEEIPVTEWDRGWFFKRQIFEEDLDPDWQEIDTGRVRVERVRDFGAVWLALQISDILGLREFFEKAIPIGQAEIGWDLVSRVLVTCRLIAPSSELHIAECLYERTALEDLLGLPADKINDDRLYRSLDKLLVCKDALEVHLKKRFEGLFAIEYDILLYDVTSTFIEGEGARNEQMKRGYSRDHRPDCKQVCIALVVTRCGMPLGYQVFDGNTTDVTTVEQIVTGVEARYGKADRIWVMDRGMMSEDNIEFLKQEERRYILGAPRATLKKFEQELLKDDWSKIRDGLDVKLCASEDGTETYILCRSRDRQAKEKAMHQKFEKQIEDGLTAMAAGCQKKKQCVATINRRIGALLAKNSRARRLFQVDVKTREDGGADVVWEKVEAQRTWSELSEGCYLLRSNITDWSAEDLWKAYIQLTEAEMAFRIQKDDLKLRPIWHQKKDRVQAHILVCFLAFVIWKTFGQLCKRAHLGDEPRQVFEEIAQIKMVDVVMQTKQGHEIRRRCITEPTKSQKILLDMLRLRLPKQIRIMRNVV